jgi:DNA end-binding protein Ku
MANARRQRKHEVDEAEEGAVRPRAIWSGTISFGLVSIPVELFPAVRPGRPGLRLIGPSGLPVHRRYVCSKDGKPVDGDELVRGYELESGRHVVVTDAELEALLPKKSRDIDLTRFVPLAEIDPMLFGRAYFLVPGERSAKAYRLLAEVIEREERAGIATFVMRDHEYLVAIIAHGGGLRAETLRFADEVRTAAKVGLPEPTKVPAAAKAKLARAITARAKASLDPDELVDPWSERLEALAAKKRKKREDVVRVPEEAEGEQLAEVIDLMAVLKQSLATGGGRRARDVGGRRTAAKRSSRARRAS